MTDQQTRGRAAPLLSRSAALAAAALERMRASARRPPPALRRRHWRTPVLAYHRIADGGPDRLAAWRVSPDAFEAQMRWLRANGFKTVTSAALDSGRGRNVLLTFDDGYADFASTAWPILRAQDFTAEVFLVSDLVGRTAEWDASYGPAAQLMDWPTIARLAREGVAFGSHMASHTDAMTLSRRALLDEAVRSRAEIEQRLGRRVISLAAPYGSIDARFEAAAARAGYRWAFSCAAGVASEHGNRFALPRIEVAGDWDLARFASALLDASARQAVD